MTVSTKPFTLGFSWHTLDNFLPGLDQHLPLDKDWLPYFAPMIGFGLVLAAPDYFEGVSPVFWLGLRAAIPFGLFAFFAFRGAYPELKDFRPGAAAALDIAVGLVVAVLWMAPYVWFEILSSDGGKGFDASHGGTAALVLRFIGFATVTPFIEELLVRSFLMRSADLWDTHKHFRDVPVGYYTMRGFLFTLLWFTFTHAQWEWPVAAATGAIYNLWLYRRKHIGSLILAHAVTNATIFFAVVWAAGHGRDWWFFL